MNKLVAKFIAQELKIEFDNIGTVLFDHGVNVWDDSYCSEKYTITVFEKNCHSTLICQESAETLPDSVSMVREAIKNG